MALSRIWSYIILVSILVAGYHYLQGDKNIFNDLVTSEKLKEGKEFSEVHFFIADNSLANDTGLWNSLASKLKTANWHETKNILESNYIIVFNKNTSEAREAIKKNIAQYLQINSSVDSFPPQNIGVAKDPIPMAAETKARAILDRQKIISVDKIAYFLPKNIDGIFETGKFSITLVIGLIGTLALFMGLLSIAEAAGGINFLSRIISPFLSRLFPEIPKGHASFGHMVMNFSANLLGLDNAATPFGLKAMQSLQDINPEKEKASNSQIMFLSLHASGLTIIPVSIIAVRAANGSHNPNEVFIPLILSTFVCTMTAMLLCAFKQKINVFQPKIFIPVFSITASLGLFVWFLKTLAPYALEQFSDSFSNGAILLVFLLVIGGGLLKRANIFDAFVEGAKGGFETAVRIIPYMVGMLVAVSMLRTSGAFDLVIIPIKNLIALSGMDTQWAEGLPTALLRPFSAGGARGFMIDAMRTYGPDSFIGKMVCVLQGSSETTFYVVALYFGSVSIKDTRYSIPIMLLADLAGVVFSIAFCYYLWA